MAAAAADDLEALAKKALAAHGLGGAAFGASAPQPPKSPGLWERFRACAETKLETQSIENRFFAGFDDGELDWARPVHGVVADFKGDGMQLGMLLDRLERRGEQYVFVAGSNPGFNGGWHFSAVDDFEHPAAQRRLAPDWRGVRVWTRVSYVCTLDAEGRPALAPRDRFNPAARHEAARPVAAAPGAEGLRFASLIFTGGLMPHTLVATAVSDDGAMGRVVAAALAAGAGTTVASIGHGLDVVLAGGTAPDAPPLIAGLEAAVFPGQEPLRAASGLLAPSSGGERSEVCRAAAPSGAALLTASHWSATSAEAFLEALGLGAPSADSDVAMGPRRSLRLPPSEEAVAVLDVGLLAGMSGASFDDAADEAAASRPRTAVFVDEVADPVEIFTIVSELRERRMSFTLLSHSASADTEACPELRRVATETVFGNPMYPLKECRCVLPTLPCDRIPAGTRFDSFFVAGGQCPYFMQRDVAVAAVMDGAAIAAPVCHGAEALHGSKWLAPGGSRFTAYTGCWPSFRAVIDRFERKKPGETMRDGNLFSGNAPLSTKALATEVCAAILELRASAAA